MNDVNILFERYVDVGDKIIFPAFNHNCLYSMEKESKYVEFLGEIPCSKMCSRREFFSIAMYKDIIILIPYEHDSIVLYDIVSRRFKTIELRKASSFDNIKNSIENYKFAYCAIWGNRLYAFPHFYPALVVLDLDTHELVYDTEFIDVMEVNKTYGEPYVTDIDVIGSKVYGSLGCFNGIMIYDMLLGTLDICRIDYSGEGFNGIKVDGDNIILSPRLKGTIAIYNQKSNECYEYTTYPEGCDDKQIIPFHGICRIKGGYLFVPALASEMLFLDLEKKELLNVKKVSNVLRGRVNKILGIDRLLAYGMEDDMVWFINGVDNLFYVYDFNSMELSSSKLTCEECPVSMKDILLEAFHYQTGEVIREDEDHKLIDFITILKDVSVECIDNADSKEAAKCLT